MRTLFIVSAMLLLAGAAEARVRWGLVGASQWSRLTGADVTLIVPPGPIATDVKSSAAPAVGGVVAWCPGGSFGIEAEPQLVDLRDETRYSVSSPGPWYDWRTVRRLTSVALPVRAVWSPWAHVRLSGGPEVRYLARATSTSFLLVLPTGATARMAVPSAAAADIFEDFPASADVASLHRRWAFGASLGAGLAWPMGDHEGRLDVRWVRGFTDLTRVDDETRTWDGVQAAFGVLW